MPAELTSDVLRQAAFGAGEPLPAPVTAQDAWHRAVALGGRGSYSAARTELRWARLLGASGAVLSLVSSTEASFLRQLGDHRGAARLDGDAWATATDRASAADASTGLAADALGIGRFALAERLLERAAALVYGENEPVGEQLSESSHAVAFVTETAVSAADSGLWRQRIRLDWVTAELAMAQGRADRAGVFARSASERAAASESVRHQVKSQLILAASSCVAGAVDEAAEMAYDVQERCERHCLLPLRWAAAMLCNGVRPDPDAAATVAACEREIERRGGKFRKTPVLPDGVGTGS